MVNNDYNNYYTSDYFSYDITLYFSHMMNIYIYIFIQALHNYARSK